MILDRTLTSSVYIVYKNKVLLHMHKKHKTLFPVGGHMLPNEVPHETAIREAYEESGLHIELHNSDTILDLGRVIQLQRPVHVLLENVGKSVENIDFIYFAKAFSNELRPHKGESQEFYWFSRKEIEDNINIKPHVKVMAMDALDILCNND